MPTLKGFAEAALWCQCARKKRLTSAFSKFWIGKERSISTNNKRAGGKKAGPVIRVKARRPPRPQPASLPREI